jgi:hypothetical protein
LHTAGYLGEQPTTMEPESEEEANALPAKD